MKSTLICSCLAILILALSNSEVRCGRISQLSARYTAPKEEGKINKSSSPSKTSPSNSQSSDHRPYERVEVAHTERQDTKHSDIESSPTKYQNSQKSNVNVPTENVVRAERDQSPELGARPARQWRPSTPDHASSVASNAQTSRTSTRSKQEAVYSPSVITRGFENQVTSTVPTGFRTESTTVSDRWTSTSPSTRSRSATKATTVGTGRSTSSTGGGIRYTSTTESSSIKTNQTKEKDEEIVFRPTARSTIATMTTTAASQRSTSSSNVNYSTTLAPNVTNAAGNTTEKIDNRVIIDVPEHNCPEGERKDTANKCRKVL